MISATKMYPLDVKTTGYTDGVFQFSISRLLSHGLNEVLDEAAIYHTDPIPLAHESSNPNVYASVIAVKNALGEFVAVWHSEPMFRSIHAALDHANDMLGCELFPLICDCDGWANETL